MVMHTCNPSTWEAEAGVSRDWGKPGLHSKTLFQKKKKRLRTLKERSDRGGLNCAAETCSMQMKGMEEEGLGSPGLTSGRCSQDVNQWSQPVSSWQSRASLGSALHCVHGSVRHKGLELSIEKWDFTRCYLCQVSLSLLSECTIRSTECRKGTQNRAGAQEIFCTIL
jgi:hypothetical protein